MTDNHGGGVAVIVDIISPAWGDAGLELERIVITAARAAVIGAGVALPASAELGFRLCNDAEMRTLNRAWRGRDAATNVLAFVMNEAPGPGHDDPMLGDVLVAYETCAAEAQEQGKPLSDHLSHLVVHGTLHLLGFDHENDDDAEAMEELERAVLNGLGITDPYRGDEAA
ncbi:MAG: rRNA maturation RNase YbeY [Rhodospirillaceae bacterium]|nr:rRNA maturation RNase YbeY [Rhodospirillaceae bacterium]|tara:strand:+ start:453 stop:962 length:510 start_codon:yes stop_codon:yes gene_type:complete